MPSFNVTHYGMWKHYALSPAQKSGWCVILKMWAMFFAFNFSSSAKNNSFIEFGALANTRTKSKTIRPKVKLQNNGLKTSLKTKIVLKTYVTAKYHLRFFFQNYSVYKLELDVCFF